VVSVGVWSVECGVQSAECGVRSAECGVRRAECGVRRFGYDLAPQASHLKGRVAGATRMREYLLLGAIANSTHTEAVWSAPSDRTTSAACTTNPPNTEAAGT